MLERRKETSDAGVDAVEEARLLRRRADARREPLVVSVGGTGLRIIAAAVLRSLETQTDPREVGVRLADPWTVDSRVDSDRPVLIFAHAGHVELERLPRPQTFLDLFR